MTTESDAADWNEVLPAIQPIISTWLTGSELRWAEHAWGLLAKAGLTSYSTEIERTRCLLRAGAVGRFYLEFCVRAFDEGSPDDWEERVGVDLIGSYPLIDAFTLGQLTEREGIDADNSPYSRPSGSDEALLELVNVEYPRVAEALRRAYGDAELFASLYLSQKPQVDYPLHDEQVSEIVNQFSFNGMDAWGWLTEGSP